MKRIISIAALLCTLCILLSSCSFAPAIGYLIQGIDEIYNEIEPDRQDPPSSQSWDEGNALTKTDLEVKYGIDIRDPDSLLSGSEGGHFCSVIDEALDIFSVTVIRELMDSLRNRGTSFYIEFLDEDSDNLGETNYEYNTIYITIFSPRNSVDPMVTNGITVETISHEFGHVFHDELEERYGTKEIKSTWTLLNGPYEYGDYWDEGCEAYFSYDYGLTDYYEDVATVFEDLAAYPLSLSARLAQPECEPLYLKAKYLHTMMSECFDLEDSSLFDAYLTAQQRKGDEISFWDSLADYDEKPEEGDGYIGWLEDLFGISA